MNHQKLLRALAWLCVVLIWVTRIATPLPLAAQTLTPTPTPGPGDPILPNEKPPATATPKPEPRFEIGHFSTSPDQPRINEAFELHLEIINVGARAAIGWTIANSKCNESATDTEIFSVGSCRIPLPTIDPKQSSHVTLHLRAKAQASDKEQSIGLELHLNLSPPVPERLQKLNLSLFFLPARDIAEATPTLVRPFPKPDILVQRTWTAKARSTVEELLTPVPLVINQVPVLPMVVGGPEFELVVEVRNQGSVEATDIFIDFCAGKEKKFNPVGSSCQKYVPATLAPGVNAIASQTLAFKNDQSNMRDRGEPVTLSITYEFWYVEQWLQETVTHTIYLYPQFYPAATPVPAMQTPYLIVNTSVLNIRQGPGTNYLVVDVAYQHERFAITGKHNDWWQIDFRGVTAWAAAYYVIAWGGERVPDASIIPPPPPKEPPDPDPVEANAANLPLAVASVEPSPGGETLTVPVADQTQTSEVVFVNEAIDGEETATASFNTVISEALVVVERYTTIPERIGGDSPFTLELALRNTGQTAARQLVLEWRSDQVVPLGAGTTRWLDDLAPGGVVIVTGQFLLVDQTLEKFIQLPLEVLYTEASGHLVSHVEQLTLLQQRPDGVLSLAPPAPNRDARPLWLRLLLGLLGLGAEP